MKRKSEDDMNGLEILRDVSIRVHPKNLRGVSKWELLNVVNVFLHCLEHCYGVALVEVKCWLEHALIEPKLMGKE